MARMRRERWSEVVAVFLKLGAMSYGGPAIMGVMQQEIQTRRHWVSRERFVEGLALVNMLPGPLAVQLSIFLGYSRLGWLGGVLGGVCFILPAFFIMLGLTVIYSRYGAIPAMRGVFYGLSPVVIGIFAVATFRLGKSAVRDLKQVAIAVVSLAVMAFTPFGIVLPHAVPDVTTSVLTLATVVAIIAWRVSPLPAMAAGGAIGAVLKAR